MADVDVLPTPDLSRLLGSTYIATTVSVASNSSPMGYLYCFSNRAMPGLLKIGLTTRTIEERLAEANGSDTWRPPYPYVCEVAKFVYDVKKKEDAIHKVLEKYTERITKSKEFFRVSIDQVIEFMDLMDGSYTVHPSNYSDDDELEIDGVEKKSMLSGIEKKVRGSEVVTLEKKTLKNYVKDNQKIRHKSKISIWECYYSAKNDKLIRGENEYASITAFIRAHNKEDGKPDKSINGWSECEIFYEPDIWITLSEAKEI